MSRHSFSLLLLHLYQLSDIVYTHQFLCCKGFHKLKEIIQWLWSVFQSFMQSLNFPHHGQLTIGPRLTHSFLMPKILLYHRTIEMTGHSTWNQCQTKAPAPLYWLTDQRQTKETTNRVGSGWSSAEDQHYVIFQPLAPTSLRVELYRTGHPPDWHWLACKRSS